MGVAPALTGGENTALAGPSVPRWYAFTDTTGASNTVATARVNAPSGLVYPLADLPVDTTVTWSDIAFNNVVFIGSTAGGFDRGIYRVRKTVGTADSLHMMAIGENDSGEINLPLRRVGIQDNDYVTVLKRFDIFGVNPRIDYSGLGLDAAIYEDWDNPSYYLNRYPPPIVNITIDGQPANYGTHVYGETSKTLDITATFTLWPTSSSATWLWTLPAGWTLNSGSLSGSGLTNTINVTIPHAADAYVLQMTAVENNLSYVYAYRKVWIGSNTYPPIPIVKIDSDVDDRTGSRRTITFNSLTNMSPGAMVHMVDMGVWNGSDVATARKCFTGYVQSRRETTGIGVANVSLDLVGPSYMLDLIGGQSQILSAVNTDPASWQQLYYTLSYLDFIIWWILSQRASGILQMFNYTSFGLTNSQERMTDWRIDTGTLLSQVQAQAKRYGGGNFGADPTGEIMLRRHPSRIPWADRSSIPIRDTLTSGKYNGADLTYDEHPGLRRLRGECFYSDGITTVTPVWCDAPPVPGQGSREEKLERMITDSPTDLYVLTGNEYAARNNPYPAGTIKIPKNYAVFYPAQMSRIGLDIAAPLRYDGQAYTGYMIAQQVTYTHNQDWTIDVVVTVEGETVGVAGIDVEIPTPDPTAYNSRYQAIPFSRVPPWRSNNPNPAGTRAGAKPKLGTSNPGGYAFCGDATHVYLASNVFGTIRYKNVTPSTLGSYQVKHGTIAVGTTRAYFVASDGTNSKIWSCPDITAAVPAWTASAAFTGVYTLIRTTGTAGTVLVYTPGDSSWTHTFDFAINNQGFSQAPEDGTGYDGTYIAATGWRGNAPAIAIAIPNDGIWSTASLYMSSSRPGAILLQNNTTYANTAAWNAGQFGRVDGSSTLITGSFTGAPLYIAAGNYLSVAVGIPPASVTLTKLIVGGPGADPFGGGGGSTAVRVSIDYGATVGSPVTVGTSSGFAGGFDIPRTGTNSFGAASGHVKTATTFGGAYSNASDGAFDALNILLPWYQRNSTSVLNTSEYIYGLAAAVASKSLYWVVGGTKVNITPTFSGNPGLSVGPNDLTTWKGTHLAKLASFGGATHLAISKSGGTSWVDKGAQAGATVARIQRLATTPGKLVIAGSIIKTSIDFGTTLVTQALPTTAALLFIELLG